MLTTEQILEHVRNSKLEKSECNIKTLNTIDTINIKNYNTKNYDISSAFADGNAIAEKPLPNSTSCSLGQEKEEHSSLVNPGSEISAPEIAYLSASLKAPKTLTRTLNVDFRLSTSPSGKFNKIVYSLTNRYREFFANIPEEHHGDWEYQQAWEYYHGLVDKNKWIGKGRPRGRFNKGVHVNQKIKFGLACVLELRKDIYIANVWIEGNHYAIELSPTANTSYPFRYDSKTVLSTTEYLPRGGWL
jgi:hypothetical protein